jgi:hypothetical protein
MNLENNKISGGLHPEASTASSPMSLERRRGERRQGVWRSLLQGSFSPRRRLPRRGDERGVAAVDWHHPRWLAIAVLIVTFSCLDAFLTLLLMQNGAYEANPLMAPLVADSALGFAAVKVLLTAFGVLILTQLAWVRAFGRLPVGAVLYTVLALYALLLLYEYRLLNHM